MKYCDLRFSPGHPRVVRAPGLGFGLRDGPVDGDRGLPGRAPEVCQRSLRHLCDGKFLSPQHAIAATPPVVEGRRARTVPPTDTFFGNGASPPKSVGIVDSGMTSSSALR